MLPLQPVDDLVVVNDNASERAKSNYNFPVRISDEKFLQRRDNNRLRECQIFRFNSVLVKTNIFVNQQIVLLPVRIIWLSIVLKHLCDPIVEKTPFPILLGAEVVAHLAFPYSLPRPPVRRR